MNLKVDVFESHFIDALRVCMSTLVSGELKNDDHHDQIVMTDVVSTISFQSTKIAGKLSLLFPKESFLWISNKMLGENEQEISSSNVDAAAEILNMIYASARVKLNQLGHDFIPAIPTVSIETKTEPTPSDSNTFKKKLKIEEKPFLLVGVFCATGE